MSMKNKLTPEQQVVLDLMVKDAFSSIAVHCIGDRLANGLHTLADATQNATNVTARMAGTAQVCAVPAIKQAWCGVKSLFPKNTLPSK
jgi:hypothetical protein